MRRWLLIVTCVLVVVLGATWWFLPSIVQTLALQFAAGAGLRDLSLDLKKVGIDRAHAERLRLTLDTANGPIMLDLQNVTVRYNIQQKSINELHAVSGEAVWRQEPLSDTSSDAIVVPPLPASKIHIDRLRVSLLTPWASLSVPGSVKARTDPRQGISLNLQGDNEEVLVKLPPDAAKLSFHLRNKDNLSILNADVGDPLGDRTSVDLRADLAALRAWLAHRLQTDKVVLDHLRAARLQKGQFSARMVYDPKTLNWLFPDMRLDLQRLVALDIESSLTLIAAATPSKDGWLLQVLENSTLALTGAGLPVDQAQLVFAPGSAITFSNDGTARGHGPIVLQVRYADQRLAGDLDEYRLSPTGASSVQFSKLAVKPFGIELNRLTATSTGANSNPLGRGKLSLQGISINTPNRRNAAQTLMDADLTWKQQDKEITANGKVMIGGQTFAHLKGRTGPTTAQGNAQITVDTDASKVFGLLTRMHKTMESLVVHTGRLRADAKLAWSEREITGRATGNLLDLDADILAAQLRGADISVSVGDLRQPVYQFSIKIPKAQPANDMEVKDITVNGSWQGDVIHITQAQVTALGGRLWLPTQSLDLSQDRTVTIKVKDLELQELFRLADVPGLSGNGRLTGELPLLLYPGGVEVPQSSLAADGGGKLTFVSAGGTNAQLDNIALQALSDFRYDMMNASVTYSRDGDYAIKARLKGHNPSLYNGYPIAFNVNLTGNLPGILRASLLTGDFNREVLRQVQMEGKAARQGADPERSTKGDQNDTNLPQQPLPGLQ